MIKRITPRFILSDRKYYYLLYFADVGDGDIIAMSQAIERKEIKDPTPMDILIQMTRGEDEPVENSELEDLFKGAKIIAIIP